MSGDNNFYSEYFEKRIKERREVRVTPETEKRHAQRRGSRIKPASLRLQIGKASIYMQVYLPFDQFYLPFDTVIIADNGVTVTFLNFIKD
ncbi:MAG: hypothetical protein PHT88_04610 [Candidatus Moranbacteria bacterium]|nr:hypothetical protein [Candidatus Moranbacteria bacterium]